MCCGDGAAVGGLGHPKVPTEPSLVHLAESAMLISDPLLPMLAHPPPPPPTHPSRPTPGPSDPPVKGLQYRSLCAGEDEALLAGQRGGDGAAVGGLGHPKAPTEPSLVHLAEPAMLISDPLLPMLAHPPPLPAPPQAQVTPQ
jgi:hypothetical protein